MPKPNDSNDYKPVDKLDESLYQTQDQNDIETLDDTNPQLHIIFNSSFIFLLNSTVYSKHDQHYYKRFKPFENKLKSLKHMP